MADTKSKRESLRGDGERILDLVAGTESWASLLQAALESAAAYGDQDLARKLLYAGADTGTAVHHATRSGHGNIVGFLLESGASTSTEDGDGGTPLHLAAENGRLDIVRSLLVHGANHDALDRQSKTPLYWAAEHGHLPVAEALMDAGADLSGGRGLFSPLQAACGRGHHGIIRALIEHGADVNAADLNGGTALLRAAANIDATAIDLLAEAGANMDDDSCVYGDTALGVAAAKGGVRAASALLRHGADINFKASRYDGRGQTPLLLAAYQAGTRATIVETVDFLLRQGADETMVDQDGKSAIDLAGTKRHGQNASHRHDVERVRTLLRNAPADRTWRRRGWLVLYRAHPERVRLEREGSQPPVSARIGSDRRTRQRSTRVGVHTAGERANNEWGIVAAKVMVMEGDGVFRTIVAYL
ncbi:unnamed protein product [Scytosiphon promiscuus]